MKSPITFLQGLIIAIALPIILLIIFVIFSSNNSFKLVERDYYQKEINYQSQIDKETRTNQLPQEVDIFNNNDGIVLQFPSIFVAENVNGRIIFFRPSDSNLDFSVQIDLNNDGLQIVSTTEINKGAWIVKVFWNTHGEEYYSEKRIFVN